jgi:superfamily II DNA or RNA helicase
MVNVLVSRGYVIDCTPENLKEVQTNLTIVPKVPNNNAFADKPKKVKVYRHNNESIYMPKFYGLNTYGPPEKTNERLGTDFVNDLYTTKTINLYPNQQTIVKSVFNELIDNDACVLSVDCGQGKTVMALDIATLIGRKTLIIVHLEFLMNQWYERITQFLPNAKVGYIQGTRIETDNCDIVIGMIQSITGKNAKERYTKELFDQFGFVIFDECHHVCSRVFSKALFTVATKKMLGLSATPTRQDGLDQLLFWFFRSIKLFNASKSDLLDVSVHSVEAKYQGEIVPKTIYNYRTKENQLNYVDLITQIVQDPGRNQQIVRIIVHLAGEMSRKVLLLTERRVHCVLLERMLMQQDDFHGSVGLYVGRMNASDLEQSNTCDVILGTYQMCSEGYDCKQNTLVFATPKKEIEQSVGRILRQKNSKPLVIDLIDPLLKGKYFARFRYYKKMGYKIEPRVF